MKVRILLCPQSILGVMVARLSPKQLVGVRILEVAQIIFYYEKVV